LLWQVNDTMDELAAESNRTRDERHAIDAHVRTILDDAKEVRS